ncbi:putative transposase [Nitrosomonas cryotolerans]|uniref:helix-turn-helix domain-containing protein n=1 Tax=Nitrosomonas cryotolerans TaxID=44575 RepID=UPI0008DEDB08|nr:helix-turn-helix domain-containing protein [Nitrosomonas cryotolerans]SFP92670.1 putative transposase [Nitrosomonas cryotolerans]
MEIKRTYKFRFYPTFEQETMLAQTFGCARFFYNHMLRVRSDAGYTEKKRIGYHATSSLLTELKKEPEFEWLNKVSSVPVQQSLRHLQAAFGNFFAKGTQYPSFKRKHDK